MVAIPPSSPQGSNLWRHAYVGFSFAVTLLIGAFAGVWVDRRWGTEPWGVLAGAALGMVVGIYNLLRELKDA